MDHKIPYRVLTDSFMEALSGDDGLLKPLLERAQNDHTLMLCIREGYINIYYRGGNIIKLKQIRKTGNQYSATFDKNYAKGYQLPDHFPLEILVTQDNVSSLIKTIPEKKKSMDIYLSKKRNAEKEFQQLVVRDNNCSRVSTETDYFIADTELAMTHIASKTRVRFDMVAFKLIGSQQGIGTVQLALVEMKYGQGAISSGKDQSGICKHFKDMNQFIVSDDTSRLADIYEKQINQLNELGLLKCKQPRGNYKFQVDRNQYEIIFILANHNPKSRQLLNELNKLKTTLSESPASTKLKLRFFSANSAGYGMYDTCMMDIDKYIELEEFLMPPLPAPQNIQEAAQ